jgi:hypothetical protein
MVVTPMAASERRATQQLSRRSIPFGRIELLPPALYN